MHLDFARQAQRESAGAGEQVGDLLGARQMPADKVGHRLLGRRGRLQEAARRQRDGDAAEQDHRLRRLDDDLAVDRKPCQPLGDDEVGGDAALVLGELAGVVNRDIEARIGHRDRHVERFGRCADQLGERLQAIERRHDLGQRDRAFLDGNDFGGQRAKKPRSMPASLLRAVNTTRRRVCGAQGTRRANVAGDALDPERLRDLVAFPLAIGFRFQVLEGAAAAFGEMPAGRIDPQRRGFEHRHQRGAILLARGGDDFARQRERNENRRRFRSRRRRRPGSRVVRW